MGRNGRFQRWEVMLALFGCVYGKERKKMEEHNLTWKLPAMKFQENDDGRKNLRFEGLAWKEGKAWSCLVRLYREYDGFQGEEVMAGVLATSRKEV
ncbi:unnamed protein product [Prunus armeniaca]